MPKVNLKEERVFNACQRVIARELPLTARNVRDELGGGSFTTLVPLLNRFRQDLSAQSAMRVSLAPPPSEIEALVKKVCDDLWVKFHLLTEPEKKEVEAKYERRLRQAEAELNESREEIAGHSTEIEKLEEQLRTTEAELLRTKTESAERDGQLRLVKAQLEERGNEIKVLLERALRAEAKIKKPNRNQKEHDRA